MHFFVGNTSPSVYYKNDTVYIGSDGYDYDTDEEIPFVEDAECAGSVCTDLWWVTAFDYEVYKKMVLEKIGEENEFESTYKENGWGFAQVNVKPGVYKCTHYYETLDKDSSEPQIYSKMEWVREIQIRGFTPVFCVIIYNIFFCNLLSIIIRKTTIFCKNS